MSEAFEIREGKASDLRPAFELSERAVHAATQQRGVLPPERGLGEEELGERWRRERPLLEFIAAQAGCWFVAEGDDGLAGYARVTNFGDMEELAELMVEPGRHGQGIGRGLLERCWPSERSPSPELGRVVVTVGMPVDLTLYTDFGVMPITGHWHLRHRARDFRERRSQEVDSAEPGVHVLAPERAVEEWKRLEPPAIGHERPLLHEFFGRTRNCLAVLGADGHARGLCWVSSDGDVGPAVGETPEDLVPVVLQSLDRVVKAQEPEEFGVYVTTDSWWLLDRLRRLGFRVYWPSWVMCSVPLPGLDRYLPTRPARLL